MSDFGHGHWLTTRKVGKCEYCGGPIPKGERVFHYKGRYDDSWTDYKMHFECESDFFVNCDGEFMLGEGEWPERIKMLANNATFSPEAEGPLVDL